MEIKYNYFKIYEFNKKQHLGINQDGGYVIGILKDGYDSYISAGVSNEESFSRDFITFYSMEKKNCFAFDGTIDNYPYNYTQEIQFIKKNIGPISDSTNVNLFPLINHYKNIFLKMDIESSEYIWLNSLSTTQLNKFKQIVIEFHGINDDSWNICHSDKIKCFQKLASTHYIIHIHGNNYGGLTNNIPDTIEVTYIRKDQFDNIPLLNIQPLPFINLDFPNNSDIEDYDLNFPPFVN